MAGLDELQRDAEELRKVTGQVVQLVQRGAQICIVLPKVKLPGGAYNLSESDVLFVSDQQYPLSAMDMFWVEPELLRSDGSVPQNADAIETYLDRQWRRFSWHRQSAWDPSRNGLLDHYEFMQARFAVDATR